jgi:hypothetical protein
MKEYILANFYRNSKTSQAGQSDLFGLNCNEKRNTKSPES